MVVYYTVTKKQYKQKIHFYEDKWVMISICCLHDILTAVRLPYFDLLHWHQLLVEAREANFRYQTCPEELVTFKVWFK